MRTFKWIAVAGTVLLLAPATAQAGTWRGKTEQGRFANVGTGSAGKVKGAGFGWVASCRSGATMRGGTLYRPKPQYRTRGRFSSRGAYWFTVDGHRAKARVFLRGVLRSGVWTGDLRVKVRVDRNGQFVDRCRLGKTGWSAGRA
jgi:hypothetical protein